VRVGDRDARAEARPCTREHRGREVDPDDGDRQGGRDGACPDADLDDALTDEVRPGRRGHDGSAFVAAARLVVALRDAVEADGRVHSRRNPTFSPTWKCAISPSAMCPRISVTSNQSRLRNVSFAFATPLRIACATLSGDVPTISVIL
jgi:hypothetical protein